MNLSLSIPMPPWSGLGRRIESMVRKALFDFEMIPEGTTKMAVALSGGKDSLALLFMLKAISGRGFPSFDLVAIHVSGEFSCGAGVNIGYLQKVCDALDIVGKTGMLQLFAGTAPIDFRRRKRSWSYSHCVWPPSR
jgi:tRNA 2-thiocytidine biosynthesis protein TtcA